MNNDKRILIIVFCVGLFLQMFLLCRGWIAGDQVNLLNTGLDFAVDGKLNPVAKGMSGGGHIPGCMLQLLIGIPLKIFPYYKAPNIIIALFHIAAVLILIGVFRQSMGTRFTVALVAIYWLSPWRLFQSGILWEPSYLYLPAAIQLWACWQLQTIPKWLPSMILGFIIIFTLQIHASFLILLILTAILIMRKLVKIKWLYFASGFILGGITMIPTIIALVNGTLPSIAPSEGFIGYGLVMVYPALKSILYWFRLGSLDSGQQITQTIFFLKEWSNASLNHEIISIIVKMLRIIAAISILPCAIATWIYFKPIIKKENNREDQNKVWIRKYAFYAFIAMFASSCLTPVATQGWHVSIIIFAACIPIAHWVDENWNIKAALIKWTIIAFIVLRIPLAFVIGYGHSWYRTAPLEKSIAKELISERLLKILPSSSVEEYMNGVK